MYHTMCNTKTKLGKNVLQKLTLLDLNSYVIYTEKFIYEDNYCFQS